MHQARAFIFSLFFAPALLAGPEDVARLVSSGASTLASSGSVPRAGFRERQLVSLIKNDKDQTDFICQLFCDSPNATASLKPNLNVFVEGKTPLMWAAAKGMKKLCIFFYENGANVFLSDEQGTTAFDYAVKNEHYETISYLLICEMSVGLDNNDKKITDAALKRMIDASALWNSKSLLSDALCVALFSQGCLLEHVQRLCDTGADVNYDGFVDALPLTFFFHKRVRPLEQGEAEDQAVIAIITHLFQRGADPLASVSDGLSYEGFALLQGWSSLAAACKKAEEEALAFCGVADLC